MFWYQFLGNNLLGLASCLKFFFLNKFPVVRILFGWLEESVSKINLQTVGYSIFENNAIKISFANAVSWTIFGETFHQKNC